MSAFVHRETVRWGDLDAFQHLNNVAFQRYFETAWIEYRKHLDFFGDPYDASFFGMVLAEFHITYRAPVRFDESLEVALTLTDVRKSVAKACFEMSVGDRVCADGYGVYVGYDDRDRRAAPFPNEFRAKLEADLAG
jgi:acyl-CoA thioester hydrolase